MLILKYFKSNEFSGWYESLSADLKEKLDSLRSEWNAPIYVSKANGAIGRKDDSNSYHNINKHGCVMAVDIFPRYCYSADDVRRFRKIAEQVGFTGIGVYPNWSGGIGFHVDVRKQDYISSWSRVNRHYRSFEYGVKYIEASE